MSLFSQAIGFVILSLIIINGMIGGGVVDAIGLFATEEETAKARADIICGAGYLMYSPTTDVYGVNVPAPSYSNVIVAAFISMAIIMFIRITSGIQWKFLYSLYLFVGVWIGIKILGYLMLLASGETCVVWAEEMVSGTSGFYDIAAIGGSYWGLKIIWGLRK